jgi:hypothetical protein
MLNKGYQIHNFISSSGSGTVINYGSGSGSDFLTSYGSGSTRQKVTVPTVPVPVPQHCKKHWFIPLKSELYFSPGIRTVWTSQWWACPSPPPSHRFESSRLCSTNTYNIKIGNNNDRVLDTGT